MENKSTNVETGTTAQTDANTVLADSANRLANLKLELDKLSDDERYELISEYCKYCGSKDSGCQCWNDDQAFPLTFWQVYVVAYSKILLT